MFALKYYKIAIMALLTTSFLVVGPACSKKSKKEPTISDPGKDHEYVPIPKDKGVKVDPAKDSDLNQE